MPSQNVTSTLVELTEGQRLCGFRLAGGVYWAYGQSGESQRTWELSTPIAVDCDALGVSPIGVTMIERQGVTHVLDWVGESHYPSHADFLHEASRMGVSRRLPSTMDFGRLTRESRLLLIHRHALGENRPGIFASVPLRALEVVVDPSGDAHMVTRQRMRGMVAGRGQTVAGIPVTLTAR